MQGDGPSLDRGSWLDIGVAAAEMNGECARNAGLCRRYSSAWMNAGEFDQIRISLSLARDLSEVDWNGTIVDEES